MIEIFYLPPYAPQANPDEILNPDLKTELRTRPAAKTAFARQAIALQFMDRLAAMPDRVARYVQSKELIDTHPELKLAWI